MRFTWRKVKGKKKFVVGHPKKIGSGPSKKRETDVKVINTVPSVLLKDIFVAVKVSCLLHDTSKYHFRSTESSSSLFVLIVT